jgi:signal transduction histidine kinase
VAHLLHPLTAPTDLRSAISPICRLFDIELELLPADASPVVSADTASAVMVTIAELMLARDPAQGRPPLRLQIRETPTGPQLEFLAKRHAPLPLREQRETEPSSSEAPRWFRIAPAPYGMPWVAIAGLNAFSVLAATLAADTGRWAATVPNIAVITLGTLALDRVLRLQRVQRLSVRGQWLVIGGWVATLGAVAGAVWGTAIGGEADSLAVLGLICALGMGLFLPAMRVWSAEIRRLRNQLMLEDLDAEATTARLRAISFERCTTAAEGLHSAVQSQLLGVAGALGSDLPADLLDTAYALLDEVAETTLPTIAAHLEAEAGRDEMPLLSAEALATTWPTAQISVQAPSELPPTARKLLDSVIVEAVGNAIHHGGADAVEITATLWPGAVGVTVDDNGCGIEDGADQGLGLTAIRSAANEFSLKRLPDGGTRLRVRLPYLV